MQLVIHEALFFGDRLTESLLCPNQIRAAGNLVRDAPIQFDATSTHSITIPGKLDLPLEMHGVISHIRTRKPTTLEIEQYQSGALQSVELTENTPWEPYSTKFEETEDAARSAKTVTAVRVTHDTHIRDSCANGCVSEEDCTCTCTATWRAPILTERCVAVATRLFLQNPAELSDADDLAARLESAVNV